MSAKLRSEQTYNRRESTQAMVMEVWVRRDTVNLCVDRWCLWQRTCTDWVSGDTVNLRVDRRRQRQRAYTGCHWLHGARCCRLCNWTMYNTRMEDTRISGNSRWRGHRWGVYETRICTPMGEQVWVTFGISPNRTVCRRVLRGYAKTAHMSTGPLSTICILPCTAGSPIVCHANLTCHRFQLLSGGFRT